MTLNSVVLKSRAGPNEARAGPMFSGYPENALARHTRDKPSVRGTPRVSGMFRPISGLLPGSRHIRVLKESVYNKDGSFMNIRLFKVKKTIGKHTVKARGDPKRFSNDVSTIPEDLWNDTGQIPIFQSNPRSRGDPEFGRIRFQTSGRTQGGAD